jgi:ATP-dependent helicase/nuclease subunit A
VSDLPPVPTAQQRAAADPATSVWVTASAGTGKTRVLADRVLRLMLDGTPPERILCITFTKAAAAEMLERIRRDLAAWAVEPEEAALAERILRLTGVPPDERRLERARTLFTRVLDLPGRMAIMTIHAFCQSLLRRFPLEAGVPPHFEIIDDRTAAELLREARDDMLRDRKLDADIALLASALDETGLGEALAEMLGTRTRLAELTARGIDAAVRRIYATLGAPEGIDERQLAAAACQDGVFDEPGLARAAGALSAGSAADQTRGRTIRAWLEAPGEDRLDLLPTYRRVFLTRAGEVRSSLLTKGARAADPSAEEALKDEAERLLELAAREKALVNARRMAALLRVAHAVLVAYERRKQAAALLDYDDLIARARGLLQAPGTAAWVLYKLDGGLDHVLVDEGQDTSPAMWDIVLAITGELFAGEGARAARRTLFVVGDEKQSIYSFQGADLANFRRLREVFRERAQAAGQPWRDVTLDLSYRSTEAVLGLVDAVFTRESARPGVVEGEEVLRHRSHRAGEAGLVEIWPLVELIAPEASDVWSPPVERERGDDPKARLADLIARRVRAWLDSGERLLALGRPMRAGDILVLLPRRAAIQADLVRAFKQEGVPVAGADRMVLGEQLAVMDLIALGRALLLPEDDLTLAVVLKSPLFGISEDDLFMLAHGREGTLLERWREAAESRPDLRELLLRFEDLRRRADFVPPFELYARLLGEGGGRRRLRARLGPQAADPIEELLAQALAYERGHAPSLQGFLAWLGMEASEVKRDPEQPRDEVRVMTVHGAKGLEAPVVILPDTHYGPQARDRLVWRDGLPLWRGNKATRDAVTEAAVADARAAAEDEFRRLLYVALTRARDRLHVCGWRPGRSAGAQAWYAHVQEAMVELGEPASIDGLDGEGLRIAAGAAREAAEPPPPEPAMPPPPDWLSRPAPAEPDPPRPLSPSRMEDEPPASPPLDGARFRRGAIVHGLLQLLPELPLDDREPALLRHLARHGLGEGESAEIARQVQAVLAAPALASAFAPGSRAEQPVAGVVGGRVIAGQIDRLAVTDEAVTVVDYKTHRRPPEGPERVPLGYLRQMAAYRALLGRIFPGRAVCCVLVWTEHASVMPLPDGLLDRHMP